MMKKYSEIFLIFLCIVIIFAAGCTSQTPTTTSTPAPTTTTIPTPTTTTTTVPTVALTTATVTPTQTTTTAKTQVNISESALNAHIQDAKNKLDMNRDSTTGYLIDANTGEMLFVQGLGCGMTPYIEDRWRSCAFDNFKPMMNKEHAYVILYNTPSKWSPGSSNTTRFIFNTFALSDLAAASNITEQGYHVQKMIALSDRIYEIYPNKADNWKTKEELTNTVDQIDKSMETTYHHKISVQTNETSGYKMIDFYDVDNLMPFLIKKIDYTYIIDNAKL